MIDIHCHILPSIDDGPASEEESIRMCGMAARDGMSHVVASPHYCHGKQPSAEEIRLSCESLEESLKREGIALCIVPGADIRLSYELLAGIENKEIPTINGSRYFLLELPDILPPNVDRLLFDARAKGYRPIITHPERNYSLLARPERAVALKETGVLYQLTAMSITGGFDERIRHFSRMLLKRGMADFVASDAHDAVMRKPLLSEARHEVARILGAGEAGRIFGENPLAVLENRLLP